MPDFVSQDTLNEARKARLEEWEKAYKDAENPPPPPLEEPDYDPRTLYERLQEQKQMKEDAFREATKFGNLIKKIDGDEFDFLNNLQEEEDKKKKELAEQEAQALEAFRSSVKSAAVAPPAPVSLASTLGTTGIGSTRSATSILASTSTATSTSRKPRKSAFSGLVVSKADRKDSGSLSTTSIGSGKRKQDSEAASPNDNKNSGDKDEAAHTTKKVKLGNDGASTMGSPSIDTKDMTSAVTSSSAPKGLSSLVAYGSDSSDED